MSKEKQTCPCCGELTIPKDELYEICENCFWEYDPIQNDNPDYTGGANNHSLNQYKEEYKRKKNENPNFSCRNEKDKEYMIKWDNK